MWEDEGFDEKDRIEERGDDHQGGGRLMTSVEASLEGDLMVVVEEPLGIMLEMRQSLERIKVYELCRRGARPWSIRLMATWELGVVLLTPDSLDETCRY